VTLLYGQWIMIIGCIILETWSLDGGLLFRFAHSNSERELV